MRIRQLSLFVLCFIFLGGEFTFGASAAEKSNRTEIRSREIDNWIMNARRLSARYEQLLIEIRSEGKSVKKNMSALRAYYVYTPYYDPFSKKLIDEMTEYAYIIDTSKDREKVNVALEGYRNIVNKHMAHLGVMSYALTLSRLDIRYGDKAFFKEARDAIQNSWLGLPQPGSSPDRAYEIVTYAEEEYLLASYGAKVQKSEVYQVGRSFYDVRDIMTEDGDSLQLFFNVTEPIRTVQIKRAIKAKEEKVIIPLQ